MKTRLPQLYLRIPFFCVLSLSKATCLTTPCIWDWRWQKWNVGVSGFQRSCYFVTFFIYIYPACLFFPFIEELLHCVCCSIPNQAGFPWLIKSCIIVVQRPKAGVVAKRCSSSFAAWTNSSWSLPHPRALIYVYRQYWMLPDDPSDCIASALYILSLQWCTKHHLFLFSILPFCVHAFQNSTPYILTRCGRLPAIRSLFPFHSLQGLQNHIWLRIPSKSSSFCS